MAPSASCPGHGGVPSFADQAVAKSGGAEPARSLGMLHQHAEIEQLFYVLFLLRHLDEHIEWNLRPRRSRQLGDFLRRLGQRAKTQQDRVANRLRHDVGGADLAQVFAGACDRRAQLLEEEGQTVGATTQCLKDVRHNSVAQHESDQSIAFAGVQGPQMDMMSLSGGAPQHGSQAPQRVLAREFVADTPR